MSYTVHTVVYIPRDICAYIRLCIFHAIYVPIRLCIFHGIYCAYAVVYIFHGICCVYTVVYMSYCAYGCVYFMGYTVHMYSSVYFILCIRLCIFHAIYVPIRLCIFHGICICGCIYFMGYIVHIRGCVYFVGYTVGFTVHNPYIPSLSTGTPIMRQRSCPWRHHYMETPSASLAPLWGESHVTDGFLLQWTCDVKLWYSFVVSLLKPTVELSYDVRGHGATIIISVKVPDCANHAKTWIKKRGTFRYNHEDCICAIMHWINSVSENITTHGMETPVASLLALRGEPTGQ